MPSMAGALPGTSSPPLLEGSGPTLQMSKLRLTDVKKSAKFTHPESVNRHGTPGTLSRKGRAFQSNMGKWGYTAPFQSRQRNG